MTVSKPGKRDRARGYSLAEALVAGGILMIGISAAASLTLTMNTQEEISWKVARGLNMLENAALIYQIHGDWSVPLRFIPPDPDVTLEAEDQADEVQGNLTLQGITYRVRISPVLDAGSWSAGLWTGGSDTTVPERTLEARAYRSTIDRYTTTGGP
ncbi:MAG: hypothetical protein ACI8UO_001063 [Verrucomicrobiales bacterium]|jgi:hypothetical protein